MSFFEWAVQRERKNCENIVASQKQYSATKPQTFTVQENGIIYIPQDREIKGYIFNIHGGGLIAGSTKQNENFCKWLADCGYKVFAIEYPLIPEVRFIDQIASVCSTIENNWPQEDIPVYLVADSAGCLLAIIANAILTGHFTANEFEYKPSRSYVFDGAWLNCPMFEAVGFNEIGIFMSKGLFGKNPTYKKYLKNPYRWFGEYLPERTAIVASKHDKLQKHAKKMWAIADFSLGYGSENNDKHTHDWNIIHPQLDRWTIGLNEWALYTMSNT